MADARRALVVDDNEVNRILAARLLSKNGWDVAQADGGPAAIAWLEQNRVDLILLDISMPTISGQEVCRQVRERHLGGDMVRIIAYTAHAMPEEHASYLACGFDTILVKPISRQTLAEIIASVGLA